ERDQRAVGRYVAIAGILEHRSAPRRVAVAVLAGQFPHRMPGADIGPPARDRHDRGARGLFHHGVIDRDRLRRSERGFVELDESEVGARLRHRIGHGLDAVRIDLAIFIRQYGGAEHEVAAVPEIAGLDITRSRCRVRLFDELRDRADLAGNTLAGIDVAIFGRGAFGLHAERHDV